MDTTNTTSSTPATQAAPGPPKRANPIRLGILLLLLAIAIAALGFDYFIAQPGAIAGHEKLSTLNAFQIEQTTKKSKRLTSEVIQRELGRTPTWVEEHPHYTVEYYCWWGQVPVFTYEGERRHYISLVYVGNEPRRLYSHYQNEPPPTEDLPGLMPDYSPEELNLQPALGGDPATATGSATEGDGKKKGKGVGKRKGKKGGGSGTSPEDAAPGNTDIPAPALAPGESSSPAAEPTESPETSES